MSGDGDFDGFEPIDDEDECPHTHDYGCPECGGTDLCAVESIDCPCERGDYET